ncbi:MAG: hypothetical protein GF398_08170 [Chitinivibrionales bacterium]|nr:hypothetical protein [Chitinivibrionales bacterium]
MPGKYQACGAAIVMMAALAASVCAELNVRFAQKPEVSDFFGTDDVAFAFSNEENKLFFVDYTEPTPVIRHIAAVDEASNLSMSPDGKWIAFQSGSMADGKDFTPSTAWIVEAREDAVPIQVSPSGKGWTPRFLQSSAEIRVIWAECSSDQYTNKYAWDGCGYMLARSFDDRTPGAIDTIFRGGAYYGGVSYEGKYLGSGEYYSSAHIKDIAIPADEPPVALHNVTCQAPSGSDTTIPLQVCNPSMSQSRVHQNVLMLLDFGYSPSNYVDNGLTNCTPDEGWDFHEYIILLNDENRIVKRYRIPLPNLAADTGLPSGSEWTHCEWSTHPYYGVGCRRIVRKFPHSSIPILMPSNKIEQILGINLKDSAYIPLVSTLDTTQNNHQGVFFAALHVGTETNFQEECWLGDSCSPAPAHAPINLRTADHRICLAGTHLSSSTPMREISVYRADGALISSMKNVNAVAAKVLRLQRIAGVVFVKVKFAEGTSISAPVLRLQR